MGQSSCCLVGTKNLKKSYPNTKSNCFGNRCTYGGQGRVGRGKIARSTDRWGSAAVVAALQSSRNAHLTATTVEPPLPIEPYPHSDSIQQWITVGVVIAGDKGWERGGFLTTGQLINQNKHCGLFVRGLYTTYCLQCRV